MRTYDDSFSGQKIYPGKVRFNPFVALRNLCAEEYGFADSTSDIRPTHAGELVALHFAAIYFDRIAAHNFSICCKFKD